VFSVLKITDVVAQMKVTFDIAKRIPCPLLFRYVSDVEDVSVASASRTSYERDQVKSEFWHFQLSEAIKY
jgi:hypothetical protein